MTFQCKPRSMPRILWFVLVMILIITSGQAGAETYKWVDGSGVLHFSDRPPRAQNNLLPIEKKERPVERKTAEAKIKEVPEENKMDKASRIREQNHDSYTHTGNEERMDKLYDFKEKVVAIEGVNIIVLSSGKRIKYIGVEDPSAFLSKNGLHARVQQVIDYHEKLVKGRTVTVLLGQVQKDKRGNYLGHVFLGQQAFVNAELIRTGNAITEEFPSDFEYQSLFIRLQRDAQGKRLGIWRF